MSKKKIIDILNILPITIINYINFVKKLEQIKIKFKVINVIQI